MEPVQAVGAVLDSPTRTDRSVTRVLGLAAALAIGAVGLALTCECALEPARTAPWWVAIISVIGFGLAERFVFHIEYRREAISFSMSEVPTAFALVFVSPVVAIVIRVVVSVLVIAVTTRPAAYKLAFNGALFAFETALAFTLVRAVVSVESTDDAWLLLAVAGATVLATLAGSVAVSMAIASFEGAFGERFLSEMRTSAITAPLGAAVAAVAVAPALIRLDLAALSAVPVAAVWLVLLKLGRLDQRHRDLEALHGFTAVVAQSIEITSLATTALHEALVLFRSARGLVQVYDVDGEVVASYTAGTPAIVGPTSGNDRRWMAVLGSEHALLVDPSNSRAVRPAAAESCTQLVVPIRDRNRVIGLLVIADRSGVAEAFAEDDLIRATRLGDQLGVGIRNALLHADVERAALRDALTGDLNRAAFDRAVADQIEQIPPGELGAVILLDLDRFKDINDTLGHSAGDQALVEFARRVRDLLVPGDVLARFGGDEFAVFARRPDTAAVRDLADTILTQSHTPLTLDGLGAVVTVSIGIGIVDDCDGDAASVIRRADIAMYAAKRQHSGIEFYRSDIDHQAPERLSLLGDLRDALEQGALEVHYQPKIDITNDTVIGAEALVRWNHPVRGWVNPIDFVRMAEETGLIRQLTDQVMTAAIRTARRWSDDGYDLSIAVNLSTLDLLDELLAERVAHRLDEHALAPDRLTLEITESSLMWDTPRTSTTIERLHRLGVALSLDDFGTGYSSLSYLRRLPVAEIKIDRSFVTNLLLDPQDEVIVRSTIDLGHNLGLRIVAEGIENQAVRERLHELGCDLGQGYGISRPLPEDLFDRWLATTTSAVARHVTDRAARAQPAILRGPIAPTSLAPRPARAGSADQPDRCDSRH
jgi:diguanylate cyclase (GGDEF)-like protein